MSVGTQLGRVVEGERSEEARLRTLIGSACVPLSASAPPTYLESTSLNRDGGAGRDMPH
jgi:hypothetical protein